MEKYKIKNFSKHMGVSLDTIKHYQQCGILKPEIDPVNNYRYYNVKHGERLIVSRRFRNLGFSLEDTKEMISTKNGEEIREMLQNRQMELQKEMLQLQNQSNSISNYIELCNIFLTKAETFEVCTRPAYYIFRHTHEMSFISGNQQEELIKQLMSELPYTRKLLIIPYESIEQRIDRNFHHTIAIHEDDIDILRTLDLTTLDFSPSIPSVKYFYSRPYCREIAALINDIRIELVNKGYFIDHKSIFVENAIDFYQDDKRIQNYIIYFPLQKS